MLPTREESIMKIGRVAMATGLKIQTIRFYEDHGLLPQHGRTEGGYRIFTAGDLERLEFIKKAKRVGLSLADIRDVLAITDQGEATCEHVRALLAAKIAEVDRAVLQLGEFRSELANLLDAAGPVQDCRPTGGRICSIIEQAPPLVQPEVLQRMERRKV